MKLAPKYDFKTVEIGKYQKWLEEGYFKAGDISKTPYTIVIPPPNITGKLHLGHVWDTTLQDIIIRRKRMMGFDALFLPGMDHASIATQAKVEAQLRTQGISRYDLGREKFLEVSWQWKEKYAEVIREQWATIGLSLDYSRERFTLDEGLNHAVNTVFVKMYQEGLIYRGEKIINWDVQSQTALSNIEVEYKDVEGAFYHIIYPFASGNGGLEIATTRPETMFGDTALMVHPEDPRFTDVVGREVYIPLTNRKISVIADEYVDRDFGTGVVKVTPAHDPNDFEVGNRHQLPRLLCMTENGKMNDLAGIYQGMERFECRKQVVEDLKKANLLIKVKKMIHAVGHSERTGVMVEPRLSKQWFVKMQPLAQLIIDQQQTNDKIHFVPARFEKTFLNWLTNIQDWCISRQLWWGHRIPAWYRGEEVYVGLEAPKGEGWSRDEDALDTWFSSALWPFSTLGWPNETEDFKRFFPTNTLVTGYDIIFFWVARMAFQAKYLTGKHPFQDVLIHGIIRDEQGRKVSKSLGNGVDMMDAVNQYGMDALRYFLTTSAAPGQDIRYSDEKMEASWNYINKIWNIARFIGMNLDHEVFEQGEAHIASFSKAFQCLNDGNGEVLTRLNHSDKWILQRTNQVIKTINRYYEAYQFGEVARILYHFIWDEFASWYLEIAKVTFANANREEKIETCAVLSFVLSTILKMLHPFMPFVTDEIYSQVYHVEIATSQWPQVDKRFGFKAISKMNVLFDVVTTVRNIRAIKSITNKTPIILILQAKDDRIASFLEENKAIIERFNNVNNLTITLDQPESKGCEVAVLNRVTLYVPLEHLINREEAIQKLLQEQVKMKDEVMRCEKMLQNPSFIQKAPAQKIADERAKLASYQQRLDEISQLLAETTR